MTDEHEWLPDITGEQDVGTVEGADPSATIGQSGEHPLSNVPPTLILEDEANALAERDRVEATRARRARGRPGRVDASSGRRPTGSVPRRPLQADAFEGAAPRGELETVTGEHPSHREARHQNTRLAAAIGVAVLAVALALWLGLSLLGP